jgi:hypothetical protein
MPEPFRVVPLPARPTIISDRGKSAVQRRTILKLGVAGGALLAAGGIAIFAGRDPVRDRRTVLSAVVPVILDGAIPDRDPGRLEAVGRGVAGVETAISQLAPATQRELDQLFALLASAPGRSLAAGVSGSWETADPVEVAAFLERWRGHSIALFQSGYHALHDLVTGSWYADESTWSAIGYGGPLRL